MSRLKICTARILELTILFMLIATPSHAATRLFQDGFESGNTNNWGTATGTVTTSNPKTGSYCVAIDYTQGTQAMIKSLGASAPTDEFYVKFWVRIGNNYHAPYLGFKWMRLKHGQTDGIQTEFYLNSESWSSSGHSYQTGQSSLDSPNTRWSWYSDGHWNDEAWHKIEVFGKYNTNSCANGICRIWFDDVLRFEKTSYTWRTGTWANDIFRLFYIPSNGGDGTHKAQSGDIVYYDDIEIWDGMPTAEEPTKSISGCGLSGCSIGGD